MKPTRWVDKLLRVFSDVREGEGLKAIGLLCSLLLLMISYYVLKTVREPLILTHGGALVKSYAAGAQALALIGFVPAYGWLSRHVGRRGLILGLTGFFFLNLQVFFVLVGVGARFVGVAFFVWVGIFSLSVVAQFWSLANDLYSQEQGERLFPIIAFGATLGSPVGAYVAQALFKRGISPQFMLQIAAALLVMHGVLTLLLARDWGRRRAGRPKTRDKLSENRAGGFMLILRSPYLRLVAVMLVLLNVVNTVGEYLLSSNAVKAAEAAVASGQVADKGAFLGAFYGNFFFWVNVAAAIMQALLVSRLVKWFGMRAVLMILPAVALGAYSVMAMGVSFALLRWLKTAENATDYSIMNTGKAMLWLPTKREEKYRAKQAIDTFFVRFGDVIATGIIALGVTLLHLGTAPIAAINAGVAVLWIVVTWRVVRHHQALSKQQGGETAKAKAADKPAGVRRPFGTATAPSA